MARFVKEGAFGGYKDVPGGQSDPECTHVILSENEYNRVCQERDIAVTQSKSTKYEADKDIKRARDDAQHRVHQAEAVAQQKIAAVEQKLVEAQKEITYQRDLNANLLRIARERANADRKLRPKKEHTGYFVVFTGEKEYRYKKDRRQWGRVMLWKTILQSPYSVDFTEEQARKQIREDLFGEQEDRTWLINGIGIAMAYGRRYEDLIELKDWETKYKSENIVLKSELKLRAGFRSGYWEASFLHTKALGVVPPEMRA